MKKSNSIISLVLMLLLFTLIFNADIRTVIGATLYWILILTVSGLVFITSKPSPKISKDLMLLSSGMLSMSFFGLLSSSINLDYEGAYQITKITVAFTLIFILIIATSRCDLTDLANVLIATLIVMNCSYLFSYVSPAWLVTLGDGRIGTQISFPGVMWKAGAFIVPVICAIFFLGKISKVKVYLSIALSINIVLIDGSRTGFLYLLIQAPIWLKIFYYSNSSLSVKYIKNIFVSTIFVMLSYFIFMNVSYEDLVVLQRLMDSDSSRLEMLATSVDIINQCAIFGCGFGSSAIDAGSYRMVIHNAYLSTFGDFGVFSFISIIIVLTAPIFFALQLVFKCKGKNERFAAISVTLAVTGFPILMLFHPLSSEFSEWGIYLMPLIALFSVSNVLRQKNV